MMRSRSFIFQIAIVLYQSAASAEDPWSFIAAADWHGAELSTIEPVFDEATSNNTEYFDYKAMLTHMKETYGGDLFVLPGDINAGHWHEDEFVEKMEIYLSRPLTPNEAIELAGANCYMTTRKLFSSSGYDKVLLAVGDHELGGNPWKKAPHLEGQSTFRNALASHMNEKDGQYMFAEPIGSAPSRPYGTRHERTSFAHVHKNVLFISVDAFHQTESEKAYNRQEGTGGEGWVTCTLTGQHLVWFENVLKSANEDNSIKHIFVMAHVPIIHPVRKMSSSGQFLDKGVESNFWKVMQKYNVDCYLTGEVHANTATKDPDSNLVQVASRGNRFQNFLKVEILDDEFTITIYNEFGLKANFNTNFNKYGELKVMKHETSTTITSNGALKLLEISKGPLLEYTFDVEHKHSLFSRQVIGMKYDQMNETLYGETMTIRNVTSSEGIENRGLFGRQYNLQIANLDFDTGVEGSSAAVFGSDSRVAIYSMGPMAQGEMVTCSFFFKTTHSKEMVLVFYGGRFGYNSKKDVFLLTLKGGNPILYVQTKALLSPKDAYSLNDGKWHYIAVSMPSNSCKLSQVQMYVDGEKVDTVVTGRDPNIFYITSGQLSFGGWGYSKGVFGVSVFSEINNYEGMMDHFRLWTGRTVRESILKNDNDQGSEPVFDDNRNWTCRKNKSRIKLGTKTAFKCMSSCRLSPECVAYDMRKKSGRKYKCFHFTKKPSLGRPNVDGAQCSFKK